MKLGRLKVQVSDTPQGTRSPIRQPKRNGNSNAEGVSETDVHSDEPDDQRSSAVPEISTCTSGNSENWVVLSIAGDKPTPRSNHAAVVIGNKMIGVGGESGNGFLDDVQVRKHFLDGENISIVCFLGEKGALLIGGKTESGSDRISVWAFDTETECWSLIEAKRDIPVARSGHTILRASSVLILFGGEDAKRRKLNDLHMFDLKSLTWLPLHCTGTGPSPRSNHVAALHDDKILFIFGGVSKSRTLNDLYSLDFEKMAWSRMKIQGFHPSPGPAAAVFCGTKWYITGGGNRKKRHTETLIFDILQGEWSLQTHHLSLQSLPISLVLVQHKEKDFLVAFGGSKKEPSHQVEVLIIEKNEAGLGRHVTPTKGPDSNSLSCNVSLRRQFDNEEDYKTDVRIDKTTEVDGCFPKATDYRINQNDTGNQMNTSGAKIIVAESQLMVSGTSNQQQNQGFGNLVIESDDASFPENRKSEASSTSNICHYYETKVATLIRKNGIVEEQLAATLASREAAEKSLASVLKSKQEMEKKMADTAKEMELLREKLASVELAQEEANSLSNIIHSDNVRLEHDVAFLKAVLDDTQQELHSTRGVLARERTRAFQLQVEGFHLKQRLQSMENRAPTPMKPFHV